MHSIAVLFVLFTSTNTAAIIQQSDTVSETSWQTYGYIGLGAIILIAAVVVLIRKQYRKFNE
ncbi:hypothetical protein [Parapedobacter koreensis]|uniref:LPXTG-motif cell wall anchor domain-containing protein n=1 Tax=Parapedobacter koreensis TaxID=332977 RepID=A0A1H7LEC3_9SPHI|nr:hypothetical protein [Parapedobacter koreensis]SEK97188.1 hypothetical protein SAMN05421740_103136 [Parapedobacter koreensis]